MRPGVNFYEKQVFQMGNASLESFPEFAHSQTFDEDDGYELTEEVESIGRSLCPSGSSTARSSMTLPFLEEETTQESLLKRIPSPLPILDCALELSPNEFIPYLDIPKAQSDTETASRLSLNSLCQTDTLPSFSTAAVHSPAVENNTYSKRPLTISDICDQTGSQRGMQAVKHGNGTKRKPNPSKRSSAKRQKKVTQSSKFCHICVRSNEQVTLAPCSNVVTSICRKAVCHKCFDKHGMINEWESALQNKTIIKQFHEGVLNVLPEGVWTCPHCRSRCPSAAQCKIYAKTNRKRHLMLQKRRMERETHLKGKHDINKNSNSLEKSNLYILSEASDLPQPPDTIATVLPEQNDIMSAMVMHPPVELHAPRHG
ncbi:hypothetical protein FGB62_5g428 [Gracilaria domingensis]|nr:hypothetical protein FGB62_5g428 [Gracilaria domingensis]